MPLQSNVSRYRGRRAQGQVGLALSALALLIGGCASGAVGVTAGTATLAPSGATSTLAPPHATPSPTPAAYPVKVFFSRHPETDSTVGAVFPVNRVAPTLGVGTFAIQQLIAGPTAGEAAAGYFTELTGSLSGASQCAGADFVYTINSATSTGTLQFCRQTTLPGDLSGARIKAEIVATLTQFPNVTQVIILTSAGHCFDDASGADLCLH
jgi:hypothetical protein